MNVMNTTILATAALAAAIGLGGCAVPASQSTAPSAPVPPTVAAPAAPPEPEPEPAAPEQPALTPGQENALKSAESYLDSAAFSKKGLLKQLQYEEFTTADATYAVNHVTVDWNEQAAKSAQAYLDSGSFSAGSLFDQLKYEGFTDAQARHGVTAVGL